MTLKLFFGVLSIIPAIFAYFFYFRDMFAGKTKPHAFSWLIWTILAGIGFFAQVSANAGIGAWTTGLTSVASFAVFCYGLYRGDTHPSRFDWVLLSLALLSLALLVVVRSKELALCLTLSALIAGFVMTARKAYTKPSEENGRAFLLNALKFLPAIPALSSFSFLTVAYPLVAGLGNASVAIIVYTRAKH
jgi:hypothetical protein